MTKLEENETIVNAMNKMAERKPTGTYEEMVVFQLAVIATMLADKTESEG